MNLSKYANDSVRLNNSSYLKKAPILFLIFISLSSFLPVNDKVKANGQLVPVGSTFELSAIESGHVKKILVEDFSEVSKGQQLLILNPLEDSARLPELEFKINELKKSKDRVLDLARTGGEELSSKLAELENSEDIITVTRLADFNNLLKSAQTRKLIASNKVKETATAIQFKKTQIENAKNIYESNLRLSEKGLVSKIELAKSKQEYDNALAGYENSLILLSAAKESELEASIQIDKAVSGFNKAATDELVRIESDLSDLTQQAVRLQSVNGASTLIAPVEGRVKFLTNLSEGGLHQGGAKLMEVVPKEAPLVAEVNIPVQLRSDLDLGQKASVRIQSNSIKKRLAFEGVLDSISPNITIAESGDRFYLAKVTLVNADPDKILPGLSIDVVINTSSRFLISKIVRPLGS